jgi:putative flippase GtrA
VRQFVKFAIVGASSTIIDLGLHWLLFQKVDGAFNDTLRSFAYHWFPGLHNPNFDPAFVIIKAISFIAATFNGFYWNRHWTFRAKDHAPRKLQLVRFYIVYVIGLLINTSVANMIFHPKGGDMVYLLSLVVATAVTTMWTFPMNKFWTFRAPVEDGLAQD